MKKFPLPVSGISIGSVETSFGWLSFAVSNKGLKECRFMFENQEKAVRSIKEALGVEDNEDDTEITLKWNKLFTDFFSGKIKAFGVVPLDTSSWTDFQKKVYGAVTSIPYGRTASYGTIASYLGNEKASRAVGNALRKNPVPPVVPCHRVIASDKDLCGFSAVGGVDLKLKLLELEKQNSR